MKTYLALPLAAGMLVSMLLTGGCVSQKEYDELRAQNRNAQAEMARALGELENIRKEKQDLERQLAELNGLLANADKTNKELQQARADLMAKIKDLEALLAAGKNIPAPPPGIALPAGLNKLLQTLAEQNPGLFEWHPENGMLKLKSDMTFDSGSDAVNENAKKALAQFAQIMNSADAASFNIYIAGHTDDQPINRTKSRHPTNWYLSVHRAVAVEEVLQADQISPERLAAVGFGEYQPAAPNAAGNKGNKLNRRVEIWILPPERSLTSKGGAMESESGAPAAPATPAAPAKKAKPAAKPAASPAATPAVPPAVTD